MQTYPLIERCGPYDACAHKIPLSSTHQWLSDSITNMSFSNSIELARSLSNEACCLIKQRHYDDAISNFMLALKETKRAALESRSTSASDCEVRSPLRVAAPLPASPCSDDHRCAFEALCHQEPCHPSPTSSLPYIFQKPVFIDETCCHDEQTIARFSFHIMFNLALAHHLKALHGNREEERKFFSVSKRLYELTFQMQAQEFESNLVLMAALLNNLSLVHIALENQHEAEQCQHLLLSTLLLLVDMGAQVVANGSHLEVEGFMGNVVHLMITESPVASAA